VQLCLDVTGGLLQILEGLLFYRDNSDVVPETAGSLEHEKWESPVTRNETDTAHATRESDAGFWGNTARQCIRMEYTTKAGGSRTASKP